MNGISDSTYDDLLSADHNTRTLGDFRLLREIGRGGMGSAHTVRQDLQSTQGSHVADSTYRTAAWLGIQAARALAYAHQNGVIHRDITDRCAKN